MKNLIIITFLSISIFSCNDKMDLNAMKTKTALTIDDIGDLYNQNEEVIRILNDIDDPEHVVSIIDNPNYGVFSSSPEYDIMFSGSSENNITITLDGHVYEPRSNGQWLEQNISYKQYYGKNVDVIISNGVESFNYSIYVPQPVLANRLSSNESISITRTGNVLEWIPDMDNTSNKVALVYHLYNSDDHVFKTDAILLEDNGSFSIDDILSDVECQKIYFQLVSGNTVSAHFNDEKLLFHISTSDHHEYIIK